METYPPPARPITNDATLHELADLMVFGMDAPEEIAGSIVPAFQPLTVAQAAKFLDLRVKRARVHMTDPRFRQRYSANLQALRDGERVRNILTAVEIRDSLGEGSAADQAVRLKAITSIEGEAKSGLTVNVNANVQNIDARTISPGYVIRLPAKPEPSPSNAITSRPQPPMIDATPVQAPALIPANRDD